jgi:hypothetical protein
MCYGTIAGDYVPAADAFLNSCLNSLKSQKPGSITDQGLRQFFLAAESLAQKCSQSMAALLHEHSNQREIRETSEPVLVRLVRNRCFEGADNLLIEFARMFLALGIDLRSIHGQLGDSRLRDEVAIMAGLKGGSDESAAEIAMAKRMGSQKARDHAAMRLLDYMNALENLPREILDYGSTKVFGGEPDYSLQTGYLMNITDALRDKSAEALSLVENLDAIKQRRWDEQRAADLFAIKEAARASLLKSEDRRTGFGSLAIGIVCGLLDWGVFAIGINNQYVIISAIVVGAVGIFFLYRGLMQLVRI